MVHEKKKVNRLPKMGLYLKNFPRYPQLSIFRLIRCHKWVFQVILQHQIKRNWLFDPFPILKKIFFRQKYQCAYVNKSSWWAEYWYFSRKKKQFFLSEWGEAKKSFFIQWCKIARKIHLWHSISRKIPNWDILLTIEFYFHASLNLSRRDASFEYSNDYTLDHIIFTQKTNKIGGKSKNCDYRLND